MQYTGRARVDPLHPQAFAVCQRCGFWINHVDGNWQHQWRGSRLANTRLFVCDRCLDRPAAFLKSLVLPPDPVPIAFPFPENFTIANAGGGLSPEVLTYHYLTDDDGNILYDDAGNPLTTDAPPLHPAGCFTLPGPPMPGPQPLPWPVNPIGPPVPCPYYLTDDAGNVLYDDNGYPLVTDDSPPQPPRIPVFVTPPLPPLPSDIEWSEP